MTFMAFMLLIILFGVFFLFFWNLNPHDITIHLFGSQDVTYPVAFVVIGGILIGLIIGFGAHIYSSLASLWRNWKHDRGEKLHREVSAIYREGVDNLLSGDLKKARAQLQKALDRDPRRVETYIALANLHSQEGTPAEGLVQLRKARELDPQSHEVLFKVAALQEEQGQDEGAIATYQEIVGRERDNRKALRSLRDLYVKHRRWKDALDAQRLIFKAGPDTSHLAEEKAKLLYLRYEVARLALSEGAVDLAKSEFKDLIRQMPEFTPAWVSLGDALAAQGSGDEAIRIWQDGYVTQGKSIFLSRLEDYFMNREDPSSLLSFYRKILLERSHDLMVRLFYGKLCLRLEMVEEALDQFQAIEGSGLETRQVHMLMAETHRRRNRLHDAIAEYQKALGIGSKLTLSYICDDCSTLSAEWDSRCPACGRWDTVTLVDRKALLEARPLDLDRMVVHHGEQKEWYGA
ncbi:MAG: tetratricopeptide repeat protein [Desulfuromonadales bacterium]|nr:tetratricopeptide repeat protein [Desulfuromonadales bacterium]